eukprot:scaffold10812_cov96-Isochrysis_galbana.AAC.1
MGEPIPLDEAEARVFGAVIVNDWSARDHQVGEEYPATRKKTKRQAATPGVAEPARKQNVKQPPREWRNPQENKTSSSHPG